jgi:hypothetical protein
MIAVIAGCGGDDTQTDPPDAAKDTRTDAVVSDVRTDTDARFDAPSDSVTPPPDMRTDPPIDTPRPPDADAPPPPPPDARDTTTPPVDARDTTNPPPPDVTPPPPDVTPPPPDVTPPPPDTPDAGICTADSQCPTDRPHCNTTTGACVSPASLAVSPTGRSIALGTSLQFQATVTYSDNSNGPAPSTVAWASSATTVASINAAGLATSAGVGTTTISAQLGTLSGSTTLEVTNATLTSIAITPLDPSNALGTTRQFTAIGTFSNTTTQDLSTQVTWTSGTPAIATINSAGLATTLAVGDTVITAASGAISGTTTLHVTNATLVSIAVTPTTPSLQRFTQRPMTATGTYTNNTTLDLTTQATWSSSDIGVATVSNTAGSEGLVTGTGAGTSTITATANGVSGTTVVTVIGPALVSITITPAAPTVAKGIVVPFTATGQYADNSTQNLTTLVTWTSSDTTRAVISNTPGSQGIASTVNSGTTTITASYGTVTANTLLTISPATLVSVAVSPPNPSIAKGTTQQFTATGTYTDNSTQDITSAVTWASTATGVGAISNATGSKGLATAVAPGDTTIRATLSGISGATNLHVTNETLVSIGITPPNPSSAKGTERQFTAIGTYTDNSTQNLTTAVTWTSSDSAIATISNAATEQGKARAVEVGTVTISASLNGVAGVTQFTVTSAQLVSIQLTPIAPPTIPSGTTTQFVATGTYTDNTTQNLTELASWSSSNGGVATVSNTATTRGLATGNSVGTVTITAAYQGVSGTRILYVTDATLVSIAVTPPSPTIAAGTTRRFTATGTYTDGSTANITPDVLWETSDSAIADISNANPTEGTATGLIPGEVDVTATLGTRVGTAHLTVVAATLVSISVTPASRDIPLGTTLQYTATGIFTAGPPQDLTTEVTWSSSNTSTATISNAAPTQGEAAALVAGTTIITATYNGVSGTTDLEVIPAALVSIDITPKDRTVALGTTVQYKAIGTYTGGATADLTADVTWDTPMNHALALVSNADNEEGRATTLGVGGPFNVTATLASVTASTSLTVTNAALTSIAVTRATMGTLSIARGTTLQFVATGTFSDMSTQDISADVTWGSSDTAFVSVNTTTTPGLATGVAAGSANVTASLGGVTGQVTLTVTSATLMSISVTPAGGGINPGDTRQYAAVGTFSDATTQDITQVATWASSAITVATISNAEDSKGLATGVATGTTNISATHGSPPVSGTVQLNVN